LNASAPNKIVERAPKIRDYSVDLRLRERRATHFREGVGVAGSRPRRGR
jgi:hypothetical protein